MTIQDLLFLEYACIDVYKRQLLNWTHKFYFKATVSFKTLLLCKMAVFQILYSNSVHVLTILVIVCFELICIAYEKKCP